MGTHQEIRLAAHRFAHQSHQPNGALQRLLSGLPWIVRRITTGGIEFDARKTLFHILGRALGGAFGVVVELLALAVCRVEVGVTSQALVDLPAQQVVHRLLYRFTDDVPARHLQPADHAHQRQIWPQAESRTIALAPDRFDLKWIASGKAPHEDILDHGCDHVRSEGCRIHLAETFDPACRLQFQKDEVASAETRRRIADDEYVDTVEFHTFL